jgi:hypothetical protein
MEDLIMHHPMGYTILTGLFTPEIMEELRGFDAEISDRCYRKVAAVLQRAYYCVDQIYLQRARVRPGRTLEQEHYGGARRGWKAGDNEAEHEFDETRESTTGRRRQRRKHQRQTRLDEYVDNDGGERDRHGTGHRGREEHPQDRRQWDQ